MCVQNMGEGEVTCGEVRGHLGGARAINERHALRLIFDKPAEIITCSRHLMHPRSPRGPPLKGELRADLKG
jgi:hypothetical protein